MHCEEGPITIKAGAALEPARRVFTTDGVTFTYCAAGQRHHAVTDYRAEASGDRGKAHTAIKSGTIMLTASGAISAGALCYGDSNGKITATQKGGAGWRALEAATADGDIIECLPLAGTDVEVFEVFHTITAGEDSANAVVIDTGFATAPTIYQVTIWASGVPAAPSGAATWTLGSVSVATNATAGAILHLRATRLGITT